ncbi:MAG: repeat-associated core domain protein, partial [Anaerocolumna sp.]|nr:repeat-associated core domain protein [Anaerocolumna sp.]
YPVHVNLSQVTSTTILPGISTNNTYKGNVRDMVYLSGNPVIDLVFPKNSYISNGIDIPSGKTLRIEPGVVLLFSRNSTMRVSGRLVIQGLETNPVIMSAANDANFGGVGITSFSDYWGGFKVQSTGILEAYYLKQKYVTTGIQALGALTLINSEILEASEYGIYYNSTVLPIIISNSFINNNYGVYNANSTITIDATYNYWNSLYGPSIYTQVYNPITDKWTYQWVGKGSKVYGKVAYIPFLGSEMTIPLHFGKTEGTYAPTGNYSKKYTDLVINGSESILDFTRMYNSQDTEESGVLGKGWTFNYEAGITNYEGYESLKIVKLPDGSQESYTIDKDGNFTSNNTRNTLERLDNGSYILTTKDQQKYGFNTNGNLNWIESRDGNRLVIHLSTSGKPKSITDFVGREYHLAYTNGLLSTITDPSGRIVKYIYENGRLCKVISPGGIATYYNYNDDGYLKEIHNDNNEIIESVTYLSSKKLVRVDQVTDVYGNVMTYTYDDVNGKTIITDSNGRTKTQWFDSTYNVTNNIDAEGKTTTITYTTVDGVNKFGETSSVTDRNGNITTYEYDSRGNVTKLTNPDASVRIFTYDAKNNVTSEKDESGKYTYYIYDETNTYLLKVVRPLNGTRAYSNTADESLFAITSYSYYALGEEGAMMKGLVKKSTDPEGNITTYTYDTFGNEATVTDPEGNITKYTCNILGLTTKILSPKEEATTITYNDYGDPLKIILDGGETTQYVYDNMGRKSQEITPNLSAKLTSLTGKEGYRYRYYPHGGLLTLVDPENNTTTYTYDMYGNLKSETRPDGSILSYEYDAMDRILREYIKEQDGLERSLKKSYAYSIVSDKKTQKTETIYLDDTQTSTTIYVYNYAGREIKKTAPDGGITVTVYNNNGTINYTTDALGKNTYYAYDGLNRLTQQWTPFSNGKYTYTAINYDKNGNKLSESTGLESVAQGAIPATLLTTSYEYDGNNQIINKKDAAGGTTAFEYDFNGNIIRETIFMDSNTTQHTEYTYNHLGKPLNMTRHVQAGDIHGNAIGSLDDYLLVTTYTYDADGNVLTMTTPDGTKTTNEYDYLDRSVIQTVQGFNEYGANVAVNTATAYDYAGNIISLTDANGNTTKSYYNAMGLLTKIVDAMGGVTANYYDNAGRLTATVAPLNYVEGAALEDVSRVVFTYDVLGRVILEQDIYYDKDSESFGGIYAKAYRYDLNGNLLKELDALGMESGIGSTLSERISSGYGTEYTYNDAGLLLTSLTPVSKSKGLIYDVSNTYDAAGRKATETSGNNLITTYYYDNMGRILRTTVQNGTSGVVKTNQQATYDNLGNVLTQTDGNGNITSYTYNSLGLNKSVTTPGDSSIPLNTISYQYDELGRQAYQKDSMSKEMIVTYNHYGQVLTQTEQTVNKTQAIKLSNTYDKNGNLRFATDANGVTTEQEYDALNRVTTTSLFVGGLKQTTTYTYDLNGNQLTTTDWLGNTNTNTYDALNRLTRKTNPYGIMIEEYEYNSNHSQVKTRDALGNEKSYVYDRNNRLLSTISPVGDATSQTYDNAGNLATVTDGNGNVTTNVYDFLSRLVKVTNAKGEITEYSYDLNGNMLSKKDGRGNTVSYTYNTANLLINKVGTGEEVKSYTYYADGSVKTKSDFNGNTISYTYNIHGDMLKETVGNLVYSYTYDRNGNLLTTIDATGTTKRTYDEKGRVLTKTVPVIGTLTFSYDIIAGAGEGCYREKSTDPQGNMTLKEYDRVGRLSKVITNGNTISYTYYDNGNRESIIYDNGFREEYSYDSNNNLKTLINKKADGSILDHYVYTYDSAGNQLTKDEIIGGLKKGTTTYTYDTLNRLLTVLESSGRTTTYEYDKAGNRLKESIVLTNSATGNTQTSIQAYSYNTKNQLTDVTTKVDNVLTKTMTYTYDGNGNQLTTLVNTYSGGTHVSALTTLVNTYDQHNQLITSITLDGTVLNNTYNAEGYRVEKEVIAEEQGIEQVLYLYEADKIILETDENGKQKAWNIYGTNLLERKTTADTYNYLYNGHADVTALISKDGVVAATYYYDAFGNILENTGDVDNTILYAGYQHDEETGLYYLNARMYDPVIGRFLQEDTYNGDPNDPLSLNQYTYCSNNPITYDDPTGHWLHIVAGSLFGGVIGAAMDIGSQMLFEQKSISQINWKSVGVSGVEGAISGGIGAATGGASLLVSTGKQTAKVAGKQIVKQAAKTALTQAVIGGGSNAAAQLVVNKEVDWKQVGFTALIDGVTGGIGSGVANSKVGIKLAKLQNKAAGYLQDKVTTTTINRNINSPKLVTPDGILFSNIDDNIGKVNIPKVERTPVQKNFLEATKKTADPDAIHIKGNQDIGKSSLDVVDLKVTRKYQVGAYQDIKGVEGLDAHHVGQKAAMKKLVKNYNLKTAPAINVPLDGHTKKGIVGTIVSRNTKGITSARQLLARDLFELKRVYPDIPNSAYKELIQMNKSMYPEMR